MYSYNKVINGIEKYLNEEILSKINDWRKWIVGGMLDVVLLKGTDMFNSLKSNELVKSLNLIDTYDNIDVDTLYEALKKRAEKGSITFDVPLLGAMTLTKMDVDKLYQKIIE